MKKHLAAVAAASTVALSAGAASAASITFDTVGPNVGSLAFSSGGVSGTVTASSTTGWAAQVTQSADGLGVETLYNDICVFGYCIPVDDESGGVDGFLGVERLTFTFDQGVFVDHVTFGRVDEICSIIGKECDDWTVKADGSTIASDVNDNPFFFADYGVTGKLLSFSVEANALEDNWTVTGISAAVPLPAAGWLLLAGVGGLAAMKRRKKAAA